jgi:hypothetical protein
MKAQAWAGILFVCGQKLNVTKCYWYAISWQFKPTGEAVMETISDNPDLKITITQQGDPPHDIERVEISEGQQTLGARLCPLGTDEDEYKYRHKEGTKLRQRMMKAPPNQESTAIGFRSIARPKIEATLPITCFDDKQCDAIQNTYLMTFLSKMGINQKTTRAMRSGPAIYSGMETPEMRYTQGARANKLLISHLRKDDTVGQCISDSLDVLQIHTGTSWPVLSQDGTQVRRYVTGTDKTWTTNIWKFNDEHEYTLRHSATTWLLHQREQDSFIMEEIVTLPRINDTDLKAVQRCRLYLKATTIADLTNSAGTALADWVTNPKYRVNDNRPSHLLYPNQGKPTSTTWNIFVKRLQEAYTEGTNNNLHRPLG